MHTHSAIAVMPARHEVMFRDGTTLHLHPVQQHGAEHLFLRGLRQGAGWLVFDLRHLGSEIEADLLRLDARDRIGAVFYTLRCAFPCAAACQAAVAGQALAHVSATAELAEAA